MRAEVVAGALLGLRSALAVATRVAVLFILGLEDGAYSGGLPEARGLDRDGADSQGDRFHRPLFPGFLAGGQGRPAVSGSLEPDTDGLITFWNRSAQQICGW